jgi:hypothetical protein
MGKWRRPPISAAANKGIFMSQTKFSAGERVSIARGASVGAPAGQFRVVSALPLGVGPQQYRVRSETEQFDRIVDEPRMQAEHRE